MDDVTKLDLLKNEMRGLIEGAMRDGGGTEAELSFNNLFNAIKGNHQYFVSLAEHRKGKLLDQSIQLESLKADVDAQYAALNAKV